MTLLPVEPAWRLAERKEEHRWLIAGLWSEQAVGIVGGEPKCCKSFLALDIAVAVAAGIPCLRRFAVPRSGRVLLYAAEDALHIVRRRFDGICDAAGVALTDLDIQVPQRGSEMGPGFTLGPRDFARTPQPSEAARVPGYQGVGLTAQADLRRLAMSEAFEATLKELQDTGQSNVVREVIAGRIIAAAKLGERDPVRLRAAALARR